MGVEIAKATVADMDRLVADMAPECAAEFHRAGRSPEDMANIACSESDAVYSLKCEGELLGLFGFWQDQAGAQKVGLHFGPDEMVAYVWAMSATGAAERFVSAAKESRRVVASALSIYDILYTLADPEYARTCRWLKWIGFEKVGQRGRFDLMVARR